MKKGHLKTFICLLSWGYGRQNVALLNQQCLLKYLDCGLMSNPSAVFISLGTVALVDWEG